MEAYPVLKYNSEKYGVRGYLSNNIDFKSGAISILSGRKENWLKFQEYGGKFETDSLLNTTRNLWIIGKSDFTSRFLLSKQRNKTVIIFQILWKIMCHINALYTIFMILLTR